MAENVIYADLNLPESTKPRVQRVTDVQGSTYAELRVKPQDTNAATSPSSAGKSCCSRKRVAALVALLVVIILLLVLAGCLVHQYHLTGCSPCNSTTQSPVPQKKPLACPKPWEKHGRKCYFFSPDTQKDWYASREECAAMASDLVVIDNEDELHYLTERSRYKYYYLGLTYSEREQKWKWINNVDHDPALFKIDASYHDYHCTVIGYGKVHTESCLGSSTTQNMCERAATMSER